MFSFPSRGHPDRGVTEANQPICSLYYVISPFLLFCRTQRSTSPYLDEMLLHLRIPNKNQRSHLTKFIQILPFDSD